VFVASFLDPAVRSSSEPYRLVPVAWQLLRASALIQIRLHNRLRLTTLGCGCSCTGITDAMGQCCAPPWDVPITQPPDLGIVFVMLNLSA